MAPKKDSGIENIASKKKNSKKAADPVAEEAVAEEAVAEEAAKRSAVKELQDQHAKMQAENRQVIDGIGELVERGEAVMAGRSLAAMPKAAAGEKFIVDIGSHVYHNQGVQTEQRLPEPALHGRPDRNFQEVTSLDHIDWTKAPVIDGLILVAQALHPQYERDHWLYFKMKALGKEITEVLKALMEGKKKIVDVIIDDTTRDDPGTHSSSARSSGN